MTDATTIKAYKGFDANWQCRGFAYEVGKTYTHDGKVDLCRTGFHACEYPLDIFNYYPPTGQLAEVELSGVSPTTDSDTKRVAKSITIKAALTIAGLVSAAIEYTTSRCNPAKAQHVAKDQSAASSSGDRSAASNTGNHSVASSSGYQSAASSSGDRSAASSTGNQSAASSTGDQSVASSTGYHSVASSAGDQSAASSAGNQSAASSTGNQSAASSTGNQSAASSTGYQSAASSTGYQSAASSTGDQSVASSTGDNAIAAAFGLESKAQAGKTGIIVVAWWDGERKRLTTGYVGENGIEPDTFYHCDETGKLIVA